MKRFWFISNHRIFPLFIFFGENADPKQTSTKIIQNKIQTSVNILSSCTKLIMASFPKFDQGYLLAVAELPGLDLELALVIALALASCL